MTPELDARLLILQMAQAVQKKIEDHFASSSDPMYIPQTMFDELTPDLYGMMYIERDIKLENTDLPVMVRIKAYTP